MGVIGPTIYIDKTQYTSSADTFKLYLSSQAFSVAIPSQTIVPYTNYTFIATLSVTPPSGNLTLILPRVSAQDTGLGNIRRIVDGYTPGYSAIITGTDFWTVIYQLKIVAGSISVIVNIQAFAASNYTIPTFTVNCLADLYLAPV